MPAVMYLPPALGPTTLNGAPTHGVPNTPERQQETPCERPV